MSNSCPKVSPEKMDWPQHEGGEFGCDFDDVFDGNFTIPGPPLDIFNSSPQRDKYSYPENQRFPRPPVAPIMFNNLKTNRSHVIEQLPVHQNIPSSNLYQQHSTPLRSYPSAQIPGSNLVPIMQLGNPKFERLFHFKFFNQIQSHSFDDLYLSDRNVVLSAPTGGGKTVVMELAMLRMFGKQINDSKVIYIAPTKALCDERQRDWERRFGPLNISCKSLTGDTKPSEIAKAQSSQIIVTTPEKWDSVLRQSKDTHRLMKYVQLILIDEIHCIKDGVRGATLEVVVTRMKSLSSFPSNNGLGLPPLRIIAVSATVPNLIDFSSWLTDSCGREAIVKAFGNEFRPVKVDEHVIGLPINGSIFQFEDSLKYKLSELIRKYANLKPTLVFCATRKSCMSAAECLSNDTSACELFLDSRNRQILAEASKNLVDKRLAASIKNGVGFHHGALSHSDRQIIEGLFLNGYLKAICTTSTLAVGVNLPAHLVIIKGTHHYDFNTGKHVEYSDLDVLQMIGRAGRPQFDNSATAVILTTADKKLHYENMGKQVIESCLHESMIEHLNAEITMGNIKTEDCAMQWLKSTFLYVRIKRNPSYYRLKNCSVEDAKLSAENRLESIFLKDLGLLKKSSLVISSDDGKTLVPQEFSLIMTSYYLKYKTVDSFISFKQSGSQKDILELLSKSEEFSEIRFHQDKTILNTLNKDQLIRFPVKGKVSEPYHKVFLLMQASIADINLSEISSSSKAGKTPFLNTDANLIMRNAQRLVSGMINVFLAKKGFYSSISALMIAQAIQCKMWSYSSTKLRQVEGLGPQYARSLAKAGIDTFRKLANAPQNQIEMLCNRNPPFGRKIADVAGTFPVISMKLFKFTPISHNKKFSIELNVTLKLENDSHVKGLKILCFYFVAGFISGNIIDQRKIMTTQLQTGLSFCIKSSEEFSSDITCWMICPDVCGLDISQTVAVESLSNVVNSFKLAEVDSFENVDDDAFWSGVDLTTYEADSKSAPVNSGHPPVPKGKVECKHHCNDKIKCKHLCCKEGISPNPRRTRKVSTNETKKNPHLEKLHQPKLSNQAFKKRSIKTLEDIEADHYSISSGSLSWADIMDFSNPESAVKQHSLKTNAASGALSIKDLKTFVYSNQSAVVEKAKRDVFNPVSSDSLQPGKSLQPIKPSTLFSKHSHKKKRTIEEERHILNVLDRDCRRNVAPQFNQAHKYALKEVSFDSDVDELASDVNVNEDTAVDVEMKNDYVNNKQSSQESDIDELNSEIGENGLADERKITVAEESDYVNNSLSSDDGRIDLFSQESLDLASIEPCEKKGEDMKQKSKLAKVLSQPDLESYNSDAKVPGNVEEMGKKALAIFEDLF